VADCCEQLKKDLNTLKQQLDELDNKFIRKSDRRNIINEASEAAINSINPKLSSLGKEIKSLADQVNKCCNGQGSNPQPQPQPQPNNNLSSIYDRLTKIENYINAIDGHFKTIGTKFKSIGDRLEKIFKVFEVK
jgi:archaellum component FlaC